MKLHYETVSPLLLDCLQKLMHHPAFDRFYLIGGTSLSLQRGHRLSVDIDLFTDTPYGQIDTTGIHDALLELFPYTDRIEELQHTQMVYSMYVGIRDAFMRINMMSDCTEVNCLKGKYWEFIVEDLREESKSCFL